MTQNGKVKINKLPSGVLGLDEILGGGLPEFSFNIIAGAPGCGKTTLAHQFMFANATEERPALYFTVLGEPALKMLRYQQQYTFFEVEKLNNAVRFVNLSQVLIDGGLEAVLEEIGKQVNSLNPGIVIVDSFRSVLRSKTGPANEIEVQGFMQRLALLLTSCEATTFLIGEYAESELQDNPVFTVADGLFWLYQTVERNSVVRKLQLMKLRGQMSVPGLHTFRITEGGLQAFSRTLGLTGKKRKVPARKRLSSGIPALDEMMGGGIPEGDSLLIAGASGTGKSLLATQFIAAGIRAGEPGIVAVFEERPDEYAGRASIFGLDLETPIRDGTLEVIYLRPLDLSVDEMMQELLDAVKRTDAKRLVIDSLAGFEMALAPGFRADFRESLYRMIFALTGLGITILSTLEMEESFTEFRFSTYSISFLTDDIIRLRYVEIDGQLRKIMMVVKMRGAAHSPDIREYEITADGVTIGERLANYSELITGIPHKTESSGN
ncbi:ATPase domain-containing protein [Acidipila rosea]|uniref:non-specific serine/threonine protein kinase n=1 Tax=Acidipila rosea TaxID=768535 RepID=A0A4R1LBR6_9BACT|nr:ATPase domain-containing protein [Acidipila rosea]TCK75812.1 circadian clock protein KaiC [Acidipila rosea]